MTHHIEKNNRICLQIVVALVMAMFAFTGTFMAASAATFPERVHFAPGTTGTELRGYLFDGMTRNYVLRAAKGQTMMLSLLATSGDISVSLIGEDGTILKEPWAFEPTWTGVLPATQDYHITVATQRPGDYSLSVTIESTPSVPTKPSPNASIERIQFASGAISASRSANLGAYQSRTYILWAASAQEMTIAATYTAVPVDINVIAPDGKLLPLTLSPDGYRAILPMSGDYTVQVSNDSPYWPTNYWMEVTIVTLPDVQPPVREPMPKDCTTKPDAADGSNVNSVTFRNGPQKNIGRFRQVGPTTWVKDSNIDTNRFTFTETHRDQWSVYLFDASRNVHIQLDLHTKQVMYSDARTTDAWELYQIQSSSAKVNGWVVNEVCTGNSFGEFIGRFIQVDDTLWIETTSPSGHHDFIFQETHRDEWSVYLYDESRLESVQLDLHTEQVLSTDETGVQVELYQIVGTK